MQSNIKVFWPVIKVLRIGRENTSQWERALSKWAKRQFEWVKWIPIGRKLLSMWRIGPPNDKKWEKKLKVCFNGDIRSRTAIFSIFECYLLQYIIKPDLMKRFSHANDVINGPKGHFIRLEIWQHSLSNLEQFRKKIASTYKLQHTVNTSLI